VFSSKPQNFIFIDIHLFLCTFLFPRVSYCICWPYIAPIVDGLARPSRGHWTSVPSPLGFVPDLDVERTSDNILPFTLQTRLWPQRWVPSIYKYKTGTRNQALISCPYKGACGNLSSWTARQRHRRAPSTNQVPATDDAISCIYILGIATKYARSLLDTSNAARLKQSWPFNSLTWQELTRQIKEPKASPSMAHQNLETACGDAQLRKTSISRPPQHLLARRCLLPEYERDRSSSRTNWCLRALVSHSGSRRLMWEIKPGHDATRLCSLEKMRNYRLVFEQSQDFNRIGKTSPTPEC
jgi:hypothetical protein